MDSRHFDFIRGAAFTDELTKIGGEMQGHTRIGRKPISIEKMLSNEAQLTSLPDDFVQASMQKAAKALVKMSGLSKKELALIGGGGAAALGLRRANEDRKLGRMVRRQQGQ